MRCCRCRLFMTKLAHAVDDGLQADSASMSAMRWPPITASAPASIMVRAN
jgi:hypothetical protein